MPFMSGSRSVDVETHMSSPLLPFTRVSSVPMTEEIFTSLFLFVPEREAKVSTAEILEKRPSNLHS